jgi:hypothetical protein
MNIKSANPIFLRPLINVGATIDIPTGNFVTGMKGEKILNGGLSGVVGVVGMGNNFKSTTIHYLMLQATNRLLASKLVVPMHTYDSEDNMSLNLDRFNKLAERFSDIPTNPLYNPDIWSIISKSEYYLDQWFKLVQEAANEKMKGKKVVYEGFKNMITGKALELPMPSSAEIDSLSEAEGEGTIDAVEKDINNTNTVFMQQGLLKTKVLKDLPRLSVNANINFLFTAHIGKEINMATGPFAPQPKKALSYLKQGDKIKGVSDKINFLATHLFSVYGSRPLINQGTKEPEYPLDSGDVATDLNTVNFQALRSKSGPSGFVLELIISQREGVLPSLTEFHFIKTNKFGLDGSVRSYNLDIYPEVKLSRTTVRKKIDEDPRLRRAINITSELLQMKTYMSQYKHLYCTTKELYEDIKALGYDWDTLLDTRGWWTIKQYSKDIPPFLSTLDLLLIRAERKKPYWYTKKLEKENNETN